MSIRSKNDISYFKFLELSDNIVDDKNDAHVLEEACKIFNPKSVNKFAVALNREGKLKRRFVLDLDFKAGRFIDADTYRMEGDNLNMFKMLLKPKRKRWRPWSRYKVEDISLQEAERILVEWNEFLTELKYRYEYLYNPPIRINVQENTQGSVERQAFAEHYGAYAEMTYVISKGLVKDHKSIWEWDAEYFLFWAEYLIRKRDVENVK